MASRCGAKHICHSKCSKHLIFEVAIRKNGTPLWREAHLSLKMHKTPQSRTNFGSFDPEKLHAAVARSTFVSQNAQNTTLSGHFLKFRCPKSARRFGAKHICQSKCTKHHNRGPILEVSIRKNARRCGGKHICQSKCTKHHNRGPILEVSIRKNCTPLWREAHL